MSRLLRHLVVSLAPGKVLYRLQEDARRNAGLQRRQQQLADGSHYVYLEGGKGEPLLLLHGFGANKDNFTRVAAHLTRHYRVIIPDHIGFGESAKPQDADYASDAQAERLAELLGALGVDRLHLGGNSMGGHIAMAFAARFPARVESLWLLNPAGVWSVPSSVEWQQAQRSGHNPLMVRNVDELSELFARSMHRPPQVPRALMRVLAAPRIANAALEQRIFQVLTDDPVEERVRGLATPALIVWGEEDRIIPVAAAEVLVRLLPNSQLIRLPEIGHLPMLECPERVADDYLQFRAALLPVAQGAA